MDKRISFRRLLGYIKRFLQAGGLWIAIIVVGGCYVTSAASAMGAEGKKKFFQLIPQRQVEYMARNGFEAIKRKEKICTDEYIVAKVKRVGSRIVEAARVTDPSLLPVNQWEFVVFEKDQVNAFALPGGKVGVFTGLLKVAQTDDELATVLGHEVAHVTAHHGQSRVTQSLLLAGAGIGLAFLTKDSSKSTRNAVMVAYGLGSTVGVQLPFSRSNETEADKLGLMYMARAGYNPQAAIRFWQKMDAQSKIRPPEFLSTHPSDSRRIQRIQEWMPEAMAEYQRAPKAPCDPTNPHPLNSSSAPNSSSSPASTTQQRSTKVRYIPIAS